MASHHVIIVGAGFAGFAMAARLKKLGFEDFVILDRASDLGGTWRDNTYPGIACDVPSLLYCLSYFPNPHWSRSFSAGDEILAYLCSFAKHFNLAPKLKFNCSVERAEYDDKDGSWIVHIRDGQSLRGRFLVMATGVLNVPVLPDIPGLSEFQGKMLQPGHWDHSVQLEGKTVGVIGSGSSAAQIIPTVARRVKRLYSFQRSPAWVYLRFDFPIPKIIQHLFKRAPLLQRLLRIIYYWRYEMALLFLLRPNMARLTSVICRAQLFIQVRNRELRRKLTPKYSMGCKRIVFSHDYLRAFQRLNVQLVTEGIDRVTADSVVLKDGSSYPIDVLVCATGYAVADDLARFEVRGRGGRDLREEWAGEPEAYLGSSVNGFPNFFILGGPNTFLGHNSLILMMESQAIYFADAIRYAARNQVQCLEVKREVQKRYNDALQRRLNRTVWQLGGCQNWFNTKTGKNSLMWPGPSFEFRFRARRFDPKNYNIELAVPVKQV